MSASDLAVGQPFPVGVNYWPRRKAMYWWRDFERDEVAEEFDVIAGLGLRLVRLFLLWEDFQPTPLAVSSEALDHLDRDRAPWRDQGPDAVANRIVEREGPGLRRRALESITHILRMVSSKSNVYYGKHQEMLNTASWRGSRSPSVPSSW